MQRACLPDEIQKMGTTFSMGVLLAAVMASSFDLMTRGALFAPMDLRTCSKESRVACNLSRGVTSTLVRTTKNGTWNQYFVCGGKSAKEYVAHLKRDCNAQVFLGHGNNSG